MASRGVAQGDVAPVQIPGNSSLRVLPSPPASRGYLPAMAPSAMGKYLARAAREAREAAGRKPFHIAAAPPGQRSSDPSTVWRFEHDEAWPRNADQMIDLYAADLGVEPIEIWSRAMELWRADLEASARKKPGPRR